MRPSLALLNRDPSGCPFCELKPPTFPVDSDGSSDAGGMYLGRCGQASSLRPKKPDLRYSPAHIEALHFVCNYPVGSLNFDGCGDVVRVTKSKDRLSPKVTKP